MIGRPSGAARLAAAVAFASGIAAVANVAAGRAQEVDALVTVRLITPVSSTTAQIGDAVSALVIGLSDARAAIPPGCTVTGPGGSRRAPRARSRRTRRAAAAARRRARLGDRIERHRVVPGGTRSGGQHTYYKALIECSYQVDGQENHNTVGGSDVVHLRVARARDTADAEVARYLAGSPGTGSTTRRTPRDRRSPSTPR